MFAQSSKDKKGKKPVEKIRYPLVDLTSNFFTSTFDLLEILENFDRLRHIVWAREGDPATGRKKTDAHREIATKLLEKIPQYAKLVATD